MFTGVLLVNVYGGTFCQCLRRYFLSKFTEVYLGQCLRRYFLRNVWNILELYIAMTTSSVA